MAEVIIVTTFFSFYFPFMTMYMSVECLLRLQCSHPNTKSLWFPVCCIDFWTSIEFFPLLGRDYSDLVSPVVIWLCLCSKYCSMLDLCIVDRIRGEFPADSRPISLVLHVLYSFVLWFALLFLKSWPSLWLLFKCRYNSCTLLSSFCQATYIYEL